MTKLNPCIVAAGLAMAFFLGCSDKEYYSFEELDNRNILEYIQRNNLTVTQYQQTDLFYQVLQEGTGNPIDYRQRVPIVYTVKSLDGKYHSGDTMSFNNRYIDYFGYFPFGSSYAGTPTVEREGDFKEVIREVLQRTHGRIRIIVPSRLMYGRNGVPSLGIPPNASLDYEVYVHDNFEEFEPEWVIPNMIRRAGLDTAEMSRTNDGIYYKIYREGTGDPIAVDSTITVNYTLRRPDGTTVESNTDYETTLSGLIVAWRKIVPMIRKGGHVRFFTPSKHAYGAAGGSAIPGYASLDFEIEVKEE